MVVWCDYVLEYREIQLLLVLHLLLGGATSLGAGCFLHISHMLSISIGSSIQSVSWQPYVPCMNMHIRIVKRICIVKRKVVGKSIDLVLVIYCRLMFL